MSFQFSTLSITENNLIIQPAFMLMKELSRMVCFIRPTNHGFMGRGLNKERPLEVKGAKQQVVAGLRRSRPIIRVELSLPRSYLEFKAGQTGHNCLDGRASLSPF